MSAGGRAACRGAARRPRGYRPAVRQRSPNLIAALHRRLLPFPSPAPPCRLPNSWLQLRLHHTVGQSTRSLAVAPLAPAMTARFSFVERPERISSDAEDAVASSSTGSLPKELQLSKSELALERGSADGSTSSGRSTARGPAGAPPAPRAVHPHHEHGASPYFWTLLR